MSETEKRKNPYEYCKEHRTISVKTTAGCPLCLQAKLTTVKEENQSFGNVLAVIHKDGGHYITNHGYEKASKDAIQIVLELRGELATANETCD